MIPLAVSRSVNPLAKTGGLESSSPSTEGKTDSAHINQTSKVVKETKMSEGWGGLGPKPNEDDDLRGSRYLD
jgi:hypothetical protein